MFAPQAWQLPPAQATAPSSLTLSLNASGLPDDDTFPADLPALSLLFGNGANISSNSSTLSAAPHITSHITTDPDASNSFDSSPSTVQNDLQGGNAQPEPSQNGFDQENASMAENHDEEDEEEAEDTSPLAEDDEYEFDQMHIDDNDNVAGAALMFNVDHHDADIQQDVDDDDDDHDDDAAAMSDGEGQPSDRDSSPDCDLEEQRCGLQRRAALNAFPSLQQGCHDHDESGNFDPTTERRRPRTKPRPRKPLRNPTVCGSDEVDEEGSDSEKTKQPQGKPRVISRLKAVQQGRSRVFIFRFDDHDNQLALNDFNKPDNWPDDESWNFIKDLDAEAEARALSQLRGEQSTRRRTRDAATLPSSGEICILDPAGVHRNLANHPAARGCVECRLQHRECSMIADPSTYPCAHCVDECRDSDVHPQCTLIIPPKEKDFCQSCKNNEFECSYTIEGCDFTQPCDECMNSEIDCAAGPAPGYERTRISYDNASVRPRPKDLPERKFAACEPCRNARRKCSIHRKSDPGPCKSCAAQGIECEFQLKGQGRAKKDKQGVKSNAKVVDDDDDDQPIEDVDPIEDEDDDVEMLDADPTTNQPVKTTIKPPPVEVTGLYNLISPKKPSVNTEDIYGNRGTFAKLHAGTQFCHPITFGYEARPPVKGRPYIIPCHFCNEPNYAVVGVGDPLYPDVIAWSNGLGYTEVGGGYAAKGFDDTRICEGCCIKRIEIAECEDHVLVPIFDEIKTEEEKSQALDRFFEGCPERDEDWCAVCTSLAEHVCVKEQEDGDGMGRNGCELKLCEVCARMMENEARAGGGFQVFLDKRLKDLKENDTGVDPRADADFLKLDGLLVRCLIARNQQ